DHGHFLPDGLADLRRPGPGRSAPALEMVRSPGLPGRCGGHGAGGAAAPGAGGAGRGRLIRLDAGALRAAAVLEPADKGPRDPSAPAGGASLGSAVAAGPVGYREIVVRTAPNAAGGAGV